MVTEQPPPSKRELDSSSSPKRELDSSSSSEDSVSTLFKVSFEEREEADNDASKVAEAREDLNPESAEAVGVASKPALDAAEDFFVSKPAVDAAEDFFEEEEEDFADLDDLFLSFLDNCCTVLKDDAAAESSRRGTTRESLFDFDFDVVARGE